MNSTAKYILVILITALLVGGGVYYFTLDEEEAGNELEEAIEDLEDELEELEASLEEEEEEPEVEEEPAPEPAPVSNVFGHLDISNGDVVAGMTVSQVTAHGPNGIANEFDAVIVFVGQKTITGTFNYYDESVPFATDKVCVKADDVSELPQPDSLWHNKTEFCFNNQAFAQAELGPRGSTGTATVVIDQYEVHVMEGVGGLTDMAHLDSVVSR